jgi:hypothetical protein
MAIYDVLNKLGIKALGDTLNEASGQRLYNPILDSIYSKSSSRDNYSMSPFLEYYGRARDSALSVVNDEIQENLKSINFDRFWNKIKQIQITDVVDENEQNQNILNQLNQNPSEFQASNQPSQSTQPNQPRKSSPQLYPQTNWKM